MAGSVLITGATAGIGKAAALAFAGKGFDLLLTGRRSSRLEELREEIATSFPVKISLYCFDIREPQEVEKALGGLQPDILINNAGLARGLAPVHEGQLTDWEEMIDTNVKGLLYVSRIIGRGMKERRRGHIINIGSIAGKEVYPNGNVYCATKHAVQAITDSMRIELLPFHVRVSALHPGMVSTEFSEVRFRGDRDRAKLVYEKLRPLSAADVAEVLVYMATLPAHMVLSDVVLLPSAQASAAHVRRDGIDT